MNEQIPWYSFITNPLNNWWNGDGQNGNYGVSGKLGMGTNGALQRGYDYRMGQDNFMQGYIGDNWQGVQKLALDTDAYNKAVEASKLGDVGAQEYLKQADQAKAQYNAGLNAYNSSMKNQVTGLDWANFGLSAVSNLYGMYQSHKNYKLNKANFEEQKALNRANYMNQAKAFNNTLRNQQSGRSFEGMSGASTRALGREYNTRKANETY